MLAFVTNAISAVLQRKMVRSVVVRTAARVGPAPARVRPAVQKSSRPSSRGSSLLERTSLRRGPATYASYLVYGSRI